MEYRCKFIVIFQNPEIYIYLRDMNHDSEEILKNKSYQWKIYTKLIFIFQNTDGYAI